MFWNIWIKYFYTDRVGIVSGKGDRARLGGAGNATVISIRQRWRGKSL